MPPTANYETVEKRYSVSPIRKDNKSGEFRIVRGEVTYKIEIQDDTVKNKRYIIHVTNIDDSTDKDYLAVSSLTMLPK